MKWNDLSVQENVITCNPYPQANSPEWWPNHSLELVLFGELVDPVQNIGLNRLKQFAARAAQVYKLLNQNSLSVWKKQFAENNWTSLFVRGYGLQYNQ